MNGALHTRVESPVGVLELLGDERSLWRVWMQGQRWAPAHDPSWRSAEAPFAAARRQLAEYFAGERMRFELQLRPSGTPFQLLVWTALAAIPLGQTRSYQAVARAIGRPNSARAVGLANGRNPLAIVVPCHRVVGTGGKLVGYGGGLERKAWLLAHEARVRPAPASHERRFTPPHVRTDAGGGFPLISGGEPGATMAPHARRRVIRGG